MNLINEFEFYILPYINIIMHNTASCVAYWRKLHACTCTL